MRTETSIRTAAPAFVACFAAAALFPLGAHFQTAGVYAAIADYATGLREVSTALRTVLFFLLCYIASRHPKMLDQRVLSVTAVGCALTSFVALEMAIPTANITFSAIGLACSGVATVWAGAQMALAFRELPSLKCAVAVIALGSTAGRAAILLLPPLDPHATVALCPAIQILIIALLFAGNRRPLAIVNSQTAPADLELTNPSSFLSPMSGLFLCALLFHMASGYGLAVDEGTGSDAASPLPVVVLALLSLWLVTGKTAGKEDSLFSFPYLLVSAGYLCAPLAFPAGEDTAHALINTGSYCFDILAWMVIVAIGQRNLFALLPTFALLRCFTSLGTLIGAIAGHTSNYVAGNNYALVQAIAAAMLFLFIALIWIGFKKFSFSATVSGVERLASEADATGSTGGTAAAAGEVPGTIGGGSSACETPVADTAGASAARVPAIGEGNRGASESRRSDPSSAAAESRESLFDARCQRIASRHGLTEREAEILAFLARGRNGRFLMDHYVVSRNTVKSHIKHIYAKLGVHSQQELIDLVERND